MSKARERRRYPRVQADVVFRPAGADLFHHVRNTRDVSLGGIRVYSDEALTVGDRLDLDVLLPDQASVRCWATVVWIATPNQSVGARFEVGLAFTDMSSGDLQRLATVLVRA